MGGYHWPEELPKVNPGTETVEDIIDGIKTERYTECDNADKEDGFEKAAVYVNYRKKPLHAARSLSDGSWTSKLGEDEDIRHATLLALEGRRYGKAVIFLKRRIEKCPRSNLQTRFRSFLSKIFGRALGKS